jgi:hypothetical protein
MAPLPPSHHAYLQIEIYDALTNHYYIPIMIIITRTRVNFIPGNHISKSIYLSVNVASINSRQMHPSTYHQFLTINAQFVEQLPCTKTAFGRIKFTKAKRSTSSIGVSDWIPTFDNSTDL